MKKDATEYRLQTYTMRYLEGEIKKGKNVIRATIPFPQIKKCWHVYQGRSKQEGFYLHEMGVRKGVHDVHIVYDPKIVGGSGYATIELKVKKRDPSDYQRDFASKMIECGHKTNYCYTVYEVRDTLISWGWECKNMNCIEPPLSFEEKIKLVHGMYKPRTKPEGKTTD